MKFGWFTYLSTQCTRINPESTLIACWRPERSRCHIQRKWPLQILNGSESSPGKTGWRDISFGTKEGNLSVRRADVMGALLISSQIKSQLFATNKGSQWGNQPPPRARWSAFRAPPDPSGPCPIWQGLRVLRARQATQHNHKLWSSCKACNHVKPDYLWDSGFHFQTFYSGLRTPHRACT